MSRRTASAAPCLAPAGPSPGFVRGPARGPVRGPVRDLLVHGLLVYGMALGPALGCAGQQAREIEPVVEQAAEPVVDALLAGARSPLGAAPPAGVAQDPAAPHALSADELAALSRLVAQVETSHGTLVLDLRPDLAPLHVAAFAERAREGFYDGLVFHRVVPGWLIQGGDPATAGRERVSGTMPLEASAQRHVRGTVSMARKAHPDSAGSQFFVALDALPWLDGKYSVFGEVLGGDETLDAITARGSESGATDEPVIIRKLFVRPRTAHDVRQAGREHP